jgi:periplasmic nitrate reductase NapE
LIPDRIDHLVARFRLADNGYNKGQPKESDTMKSEQAGIPEKHGRRRELTAFLILAFAIWPVVAVGVVGGYGFLVWMVQMIFGPPGPPGG